MILKGKCAVTDKQADIQIDDEADGDLRFIDDTGTTHNYDPHLRLINFTANSLAVTEVFGRAWSWSSGLLPKQVVSRSVIRGFATLGDRGISEIGTPGSWTKQVALSISGRSAEEHEQAVQAWNENGQKDMQLISDANLGYHKYGAKEEHWRLNLHVAERTLDSLIEALQNNRMHSLEIGVELENVYNDRDRGALNFGYPVNLFLHPGKRNNDGTFISGWAVGQIQNWEIKLSVMAMLSEPFEQMLPSASDAALTEKTHGPSDAEQIVSALEKLTGNIKTFHVSFQQVSGIALVLAVVLIVSVLVT